MRVFAAGLDVEAVCAKEGGKRKIEKQAATRECIHDRNDACVKGNDMCCRPNDNNDIWSECW